MISLGEFSQRADARILVEHIPANIDIDDCNKFVHSQVAMGAYKEHTVYAADGVAVVNQSSRNSKSIVPDMRFDLTNFLDKLANRYLAYNFDPPTGARLFATQSDFFSYPVGVGLRLHSDDHALSVSGAVVAIDLHRAITAIVYLSDEFTGGDLYFPRQQFTLSPRAGTVVVFPSNRNFPHEVRPITSGVRNSYQRIFGLADSSGKYGISVPTS